MTEQSKKEIMMLTKTGKLLHASNSKLQYDEAAKSLFSDRQILAWILMTTVSEYKELSITDIIPCIDTPHISDIPVDPGLTNVLITGDNTESIIPGEGISELLSEKDPEEKCSDLSVNYGIETSIEMREAINTMCNLSDIIEEKGIEKGKALESANTERERIRADRYMEEARALKDEVQRLKRLIDQSV